MSRGPGADASVFVGAGRGSFIVTSVGDSVLDADGAAIEVLRVGRMPFTTGLGHGKWSTVGSTSGGAGAVSEPTPFREFSTASPRRSSGLAATESSATCVWNRYGKACTEYVSCSLPADFGYVGKACIEYVSSSLFAGFGRAGKA